MKYEWPRSFASFNVAVQSTAGAGPIRVERRITAGGPIGKCGIIT